MTPRRIRPPLPSESSHDKAEILAAKTLLAQVQDRLHQSGALTKLSDPAREGLLSDLQKIGLALGGGSTSAPAFATPMETVASLRNRLQAGGGNGSAGAQTGTEPAPAASSKPAATETLARRAGALSDEINFPAFVAGLVHGTFDAIVDAAIRQMEAFADLVSAVAKNTDDFTRDNVTANQARDWLIEHYPSDLQLDLSDGTRVVPKSAPPNGQEEAPSPEWLADYGFAGEPLTTELIEEQLVPAARRRVGENRLQMLATMVLLGMNRINIRDGSISARVRFRAAATDRVGVQYAASQDPGGSWGNRGSAGLVHHATMVSTVGVNAQADTDLKAELFGEVRINFVSETLPLDRFVDQARVTLLERNARTRGSQPASPNGSAPPAAAPPTAAPPPPANTPSGPGG
jgi:hypothetical protein